MPAITGALCAPVTHHQETTKITYAPHGTGGFILVDTELGGEVHIPGHLLIGHLTASEDYLPIPARQPDDPFTANREPVHGDHGPEHHGPHQPPREWLTITTP